MLLLLVFSSTLINNVQAQPILAEEDNDSITALQIGDTIPEELWNLTLHAIDRYRGKEIIKLNNYRQKLIILDFWATWCTTCLAAMPRLDSLQHTMGNMIIIPTTRESLEKLEPFLERNPVAKTVNLKTVYDDKILHRYFPHRLIPHYIWIYNGKFLTATNAKEINQQTLENVFSEGISGAIPKIDILGYDKRQSLLDNLNQGKLVVPTVYSTTFSEKIEGLGSSQSHTNKHGLIRRYFLNRPLSDMYRYALRIEMNEDKLIFDLAGSGINPEMLLCYEQIYNDEELTDPNKQMLDDLNQRFKLYVSEIKIAKKNAEGTSRIIVIKPTK